MTNQSQTTSDDSETDLLDDAMAVLANKAMNHIMKLCGNRTGLVFAVSAMTTERLRMIYQIDINQQILDGKKKEAKDAEK